ncbi:MAG: GerMN domain-containing protein [Spirochaetia bacterium]|nr:GerMN domain-containing protein [Spirochaetia bacterium]MBQ3648337.1 GerMN domain-containing protein [Spirochaetia bacterium]MBQ3713784.1 GerMN domain-containing protein [Spirochaetia bacterium]MBQ6673573.1 GerMN domain-containing protein [Spirochaetia bacterium]MBR0318739.1 GerMN domain-containing protein [Spirochaetia bacterium]
MKRVFQIILFLALIVLVVSGIYCYKRQSVYTERTLFFVEPVSKAVVLEHRLIAEKHDLELNVELLIKDELLGPVLLVRDSVFPTGTRLNHVLLRDGTLYADLSSEAMFPSAHSGLNFNDSIRILEETIRFNFPEIEKIVVTIDGSIPN